MSKKFNLLEWLTIGLVIIGVATLFVIMSQKPPATSNNTAITLGSQNIVSENQSGGITAQTVNIK